MAGGGDNKIVSKYNVYQNGVKVLELGSDITRHKAEGLSPHTEYSYKVEAVDAAGNVSPVPLTLQVTTLSAPLASWPVASVTASGSDGNIEDNTLDQNLYTRWSAAGDGPWIMYDLGEARTSVIWVSPSIKGTFARRRSILKPPMTA